MRKTHANKRCESLHISKTKYSCEVLAIPDGRGAGDWDQYCLNLGRVQGRGPLLKREGTRGQVQVAGPRSHCTGGCSTFYLNWGIIMQKRVVMQRKEA